MFRFTNVLAASAIVVASASAGFAASFDSAVQTVLMEQKQLKELNAEGQTKMVACVQKVLSAVPPQKQSYVAEAANFDEMESRFGEVVLANQAEFEKMITRECGNIVLENKKS